jgi:phosphoglycerate dehydrogenase-like enzyme
MARTVFICHDYMLVEILDEIERLLRADGVQVRRGPPTEPGKKLTYRREHHEELFGDAEVMMFSSRSVCSRQVLEAAPRLRGVVNPTIGLETVDLDACNEMGIIVGHGATPQNFLGMAEATVMLMLTLLYNPKATEEVLRGTRPRPRPTPTDMWARMLLGRTVGLIGLGRIGRAVAQRLGVFGARILAHDPFLGEAPAGVSPTDLDTLLRSSDIVSLHVSVTPATHGMISERELALMKPDAFLINTSRGEAINEEALYRALRDRRIAGAALDNFVIEPLPEDSPLRTLENVILTPHMIGHTKDVMASFPAAALENITRILRGEPPLHCKNPDIIPAWRVRLARISEQTKGGRRAGSSR